MSVDKMYIVVEGDAEECLANHWCKHYLPYVVPVIKNARGRGKAVNSAARHWQQSRDAQADVLVFWSDQESFPCAEAAADAYWKRLPEEAREHVVVIVTVRALEAWYLADAQGLCALCPNLRLSPEDDTGLIDHPKAHLTEVLREAGQCQYYSSRGFAEEFAPHFSLSRAADSNSSAGHALAQLLDVVPDLRKRCTADPQKRRPSQ